MQLSLTFKEKEQLKQQFKKALQKLNQAQREAVEHIEGPTLVIAGPGTGKTEILSLRIGNILTQTDSAPQNILCLTYTESGALEMRKRLLKYIGPAAYHVNIFTFHAFCNTIIQENRQIFGFYRDLQPVSQLELIDIFREMIDEIPDDHDLKRLTGNRYFDLGRFQWLFDQLKRENKTSKELAEDIEERIIKLKENPDYILKRASSGGSKGDLNYKGKRKIQQFKTALQASEFLNLYNDKLQKLERYDFNDMILWVIDAFQKNEELLAYYQEKFQYILVDEYQDTNGSQNDILYNLCGYWEKPNVFVVGDDDQAIFRFQGANMSNILEFARKYDPRIIMLTHNYRSTQRLIDWSDKLITTNQERLVNHFPEMDKHLIASGGHAHDLTEPVIRIYQNAAQEESDILSQITILREEGVSLSNMAIIYRNHKQIDNLVKVFRKT